MENLTEQKLFKAEQKVKEIKEFYKNVVIFIIVNMFLTFVWKFSFKIFGDFVISNHFNEDGFVHIPIWLIWGFFLLFSGLKTFGYLNIFGKNWEERKIKEFMNKD
ncbi:MAG: 2TM domain-containing protein [Polaribacter sp.]|uniref:2TM domain-containing protein n=1 Tax=Polaribacter sp. TaxID=1920175 RepID=UPI003264DA74